MTDAAQLDEPHTTDTKTTKPKGRKRLILAAGALLGVGALVTTAAFTDFANLNLGNAADGGGVGGADNTFNIQVVGTDAAGNPVADTWQEANTAEGVNINVPGASTITPGDTISVDIPFRNQSPKLKADMAFSLQDVPGKTSTAAYKAALRFTITLNGTALVTNVTEAAVNDLDLGEYAAGSQGKLTVAITLPDQGSEAANNALQGGVSYVQAHFDATSVQP